MFFPRMKVVMVDDTISAVTGNINISTCNQSNRFAFSVHLLVCENNQLVFMASTDFVQLLILFINQRPGACSEGVGNYTLLFNTTNGIHEADINFMDGLEALVIVDWNASSTALGVYTSNGFSRSEFYPFSKSEVHG